MKRIPWKIASEVEAERPDIAGFVRSTRTGRVTFRLDNFSNTRQFYNCVWYALSYGLTVEIRLTA